MNKDTIQNAENLYNIFIDRINEDLDEGNYINVKPNINYLSDFMSDLPHNAYINKGATGCGGTTLAITNNEPYIIAVHSVNVINNKSKQHKNLCPIYSETTDEDINNYINNPHIPIKKFIVTYDSLPRLLNFIDPSEYRLLVDEVQVLIRYLGHFKISVSHALIKNSYNFKSVSYLTATPTKRCYLPQPLKQLNYVELNWPNLKRPDIKHLYCGSQLQTKVVAFILDKLDNTDDEIYVFYNSKTGVTSAIQKLLMAKSDLKLDDIKIVFADNDKNVSYFRQKLKSKQLNLDHEIIVDENGVPLPGYNKRINFISSFGFEGVDFYSHGKDVTTLIVADSFSKSMRYDISIDLPQIIGRFRRDKTTNLFPKNDIFFIWKSVNENIDYDKDEEVINAIAKKLVYCEETLNLANELFVDSKKVDVKDVNVRSFNNWEPYIISTNIHDPIEERNYIINEYAMEGIMSIFYTMNIDYLMIANNIDFENVDKDDSIILNSIRKLTDKDVDTFEIPQLSVQYSNALNRKISFSKIASQYYDLDQKLIKTIDADDQMNIKNEMNELLEMSDLLKDILEYETIEYIKTNQYKESFVKKQLSNHVGIKKAKDHINDYNIKSGDLILVDDIISIVEKIYNDNNIMIKPKKSSINDFFVTKHKMIDNVKYIQIECVKP